MSAMLRSERRRPDRTRRMAKGSLLAGHRIEGNMGLLLFFFVEASIVSRGHPLTMTWDLLGHRSSHTICHGPVRASTHSEPGVA